MEVLLIAENWPPRVGGIENYLTHIAAHLPPQSVTALVPPGSTAVTGSGIKAVEQHRFFWPLIRPKWLPFFISLYRRVKQQRPDMILCGKALFEGLIAYYLKKQLHIPYIVCTYAMEIETWANSRWKRKLQRVLQQADRVIYINEVTKKSLLDLGVTEKQLIKIWPGVDEMFFANNQTPAQTQAVLSKYNLTKPYVLSVGRLVERKGMDVVLEAFAALDQIAFTNLQLVVIGSGPEKNRLQHQADNLMIATSVHFLEAVPDEDLPALYAGAELFVLTPKPLAHDFEGFGIVYIEAAAAGIPAIATKSGGASEAVLDGQTGLVVEPNSAEAVRNALATLLNDQEKRQKMGKQAKDRAWNEFRWQKRILLVKGVLDAIMSEQILKKRSSQNV